MERRLRNEINRGVQTIQYQVVTLMTTNGQAPFKMCIRDRYPNGHSAEAKAPVSLCPIYPVHATSKPLSLIHIFHVGTQQDGPAGLFSARQREDAGPAAVLRLIAHLRQCRLDQRLRLGQVEAHLRVTMERPPPLLQLRFQRAGDVYKRQFLLRSARGEPALFLRIP